MTNRRSSEWVGDLFPPALTEETKAETSNVPSDQLQRERAVDIAQSYVVEAPAGSGKTGLLIQRYLKLLAQPEVQSPEQVLAITFTIKAAGEIRGRIVDQLERANNAIDDLTGFDKETVQLARKVLQRDKELNWGLLAHPRRMNLRTIDSICAEIARSLPILSGGSGLIPIEDASSLHRLAAERTLLQLGGPNMRLSDAIRTVLLHRDGDLQLCQGLLAEMLALRDQWGRLVPLGHENLEEKILDKQVLPKLEFALSNAIIEELIEIERAFPRSALEQLSALAAEMACAPGYNGAESPIRFCAGSFAAPSPSLEDLNIWRSLAHLLINKQDEWRKSFNVNHLGFEISKVQRSDLKEIVERLNGEDRLLRSLQRMKLVPSPTFPAHQWTVAKALFLLLHYSLIELQLVFAERGECDFTELGLLARAALQHEGATIENALGGNLQHILVDEMQDTSTSQYELIELLIQGWDGRSQTVFLVGDPKQSIYLFRQARVERFVQMMSKHRIGGLDLNLLQLRANFRSQSGLVSSLNKTFGSIFSRTTGQTSKDEVQYTAAEAIRPLTSGALATVWHPQVIPFDSREDTTAQATWFAQVEAAKIRTIVESWRNRPLPTNRTEPWRIAVLVRNRRHLSQIVAEFKRENGMGAIPFRAVDIEPLAERREVLDLVALTRALLHPADRVAWLAVLRAPWCGLELADIHRLCGEDDPRWEAYTIAELIKERSALLSETGRKLLGRIAPILRTAQTQIARVPLPEIVERAWRSLGGHTYLNDEELVNTKQFLTLLDEMDQQDLLSNLEMLQQQLQRLYAAPISHPNAVDLMTIHGAKGLEWDVVLVPGLEKKSHGDGQRLLAWEELSVDDDIESSVILAPIGSKGEDADTLNRWIRDIHKRREEAECKRLFYVACTRAREELHLFGTLKQHKDGSLSPISGTLLNAAWAAAEEHFVDTDIAAKPVIAEVITFPAQADEASLLPAIAAEVEKKKSFASLYRMPEDRGVASPTPIIQHRSRYPNTEEVRFERPEGSAESRAFGKVIHALLDLLARRASSGKVVGSLVSEVEQWQPRIAALLQSHGLSPAAVTRDSGKVQEALLNTLSDMEGRWLLGTRKDAISEYALVTGEQERLNTRMDRVFRAGPSPLDANEDYLWVIDFKTTQPTGPATEMFFVDERKKYSGQMATYVRVIRTINKKEKIRLGLYYPLIPRLIWWAAEDN